MFDGATTTFPVAGGPSERALEIVNANVASLSHVPSFLQSRTSVRSSSSTMLSQPSAVTTICLSCSTVKNSGTGK